MNRIVISDGAIGSGQTHVVDVNNFTNFSEASCSCGWSDHAAGKDELDDKINAYVHVSLRSNYVVRGQTQDNG